MPEPGIDVRSTEADAVREALSELRRSRFGLTGWPEAFTSGGGLGELFINALIYLFCRPFQMTIVLLSAWSSAQLASNWAALATAAIGFVIGVTVSLIYGAWSRKSVGRWIAFEWLNILFAAPVGYFTGALIAFVTFGATSYISASALLTGAVIATALALVHYRVRVKTLRCLHEIAASES